MIVLGAGAKAVALSAKAAVLRDLGYPVPDLLVVEPVEVASAWTKAGSMTSGSLTLGTPPEKDVGFPYLTAESWPDARAVDADMYRRFSWASYLISLGSYQEWIDRGKPHPRHREWGGYLTWVCLQSGMRILPGSVTHIELGSRWEVHVTSEGKENVVLDADSLVITGYGSTRAKAGTECSHPGTASRLVDVAGFWRRAGADLLPGSGRVIVVGAGESAAGIVEHLLGQDRYDVAMVSPGHTIYTRGESFYENEMYSNPDRWEDFPVEARREFISRTDHGVFSVRALAALAELGRLEIIGGRALDVRECGNWAEVTIDRVCEKAQYRADLVIEATGRDPAWFMRLMDNSVLMPMMDMFQGQVNGERLCAAIGHDLSIRGLAARLHTPNLAGLMQGPGFPGMSCLGLMSDRVLGSYYLEK